LTGKSIDAEGSEDLANDFSERQRSQCELIGGDILDDAEAVPLGSRLVMDEIGVATVLFVELWNEWWPPGNWRLDSLTNRADFRRSGGSRALSVDGRYVDEDDLVLMLG